MGEQSKNIKNPSENEYEGYSLNGDCYYLLHEDIVGCNCSWNYGAKTMRKVYVVDLGKTVHSETQNFSVNLTRCKNLASESDVL